MRNTELEAFIAVLNKGWEDGEYLGVNIEITVLVSGKLISGTIISHMEYLKLFTNGENDLIKLLYKPVLNNYIESSESNNNEYLYLKDIRIAPEMIELGKYPYGIKIKLDDISAFMFGSMNA